jgi:putative DNA primase/helicase
MSKKLDFKKINQLAMAQAENVVSNYAPNGKLEGREWVACNPSRSDNSARSFSVNVDTGLWADFATNDKGGDLVSYVAHCLRVSQGDAYKTLAHFLGVSDEEITNPTKIKPVGPAPEVKPKEPDFTPILPPPVEAAKSCPFAFSKFGKASAYWDYKNANGALVMRVCRFDRVTSEGERAKEYRPVVYGTAKLKKSGQLRTGWHWRQLPNNRPLYGLDLLGAFSVSAPVILVEGEKACDAARKLFAAYPCMTWSGGSKAIGKTDFSPLAGRVVWLWPDNDIAGEHTIGTLGKVLIAVGVTAYRVFNLAVFSQYAPGLNGELLQMASEWPPKSDAHDAIVMGWTAQHLVELEKCGALLVPLDGEVVQPIQSLTPTKEKPASEALSGDEVAPAYSDDPETKSKAPYGFKVDDLGVWWYDSKAEKHRRICARLDVVALCRDASEAGDNWGIFVRFKNLDGREKQINFPRELFGTDGGVEVTKRLLKMGLDYDAHREAKRKVLEYLQAHSTQERIGLVNKTGWHKNVFVLPDRTIGESKEPLLFYTEGASLCKLSERGTLQEWKENVSKYCIDNPLAMFAMSAAFSAPLVELLGQETMGFHFYGDSSWGKSTLLNMACSVFGNPEDYKKAWRSTDNGMESLAASHSEMLLALDEINQFDPRKLGDAVYMLGNGSGKTRATDRGGARDDLHRWRFTFLSNGEKTLEQYMGEAGKNQTAGMEMRFLEIRATMHESEADIKRMGVFNNPHSLMGGAALSELLKGNMAQYHGTAFPAFITALVLELDGDKRKSFVTNMLLRIDNFRKKHLTENASGQARRAAIKFGLVAWAGELASHFGVTGWQQGQATIAASQCFKSWLVARGSDGNFEEKQMLDHIRHTLSKFCESRFKRWDEPQLIADKENLVIDNHVPITAECWGLRKETIDKNALAGDTSDIEFYIFPEAFRNDVCKGYDANRIARLLRDMGALMLTDGDKKENRLTTKVRLPRMGDKAKHVYRIKNSLLFGGGDDPENELQNAA